MYKYKRNPSTNNKCSNIYNSLTTFVKILLNKDIHNSIYIDMQPHQIKFPRTAHYCTSGTISENTKKFFIVFHGYGQLASHIIYKFKKVEEDVFVVAPEGASRFYWDEGKNIIGASWMTEKDREVEIEDFCNYIEYLYHFYKNQLPEDVEVNILGFSQGGATAVRWIERNRPNFKNLFLWGAGFPLDIKYIPMKEYLSDKSLHLVYGHHDPYVTEKRMDAQKILHREQGLQFEITWFDGDHEIVRDVLHDIIDKT
jgi:predicted esterase